MALREQLASFSNMQSTPDMERKSVLSPSLSKDHIEPLGAELLATISVYNATPVSLRRPSEAVVHALSTVHGLLHVGHGESGTKLFMCA